MAEQEARMRLLRQRGPLVEQGRDRGQSPPPLQHAAEGDRASASSFGFGVPRARCSASSASGMASSELPIPPGEDPDAVGEADRPGTPDPVGPRHGQCLLNRLPRRRGPKGVCIRIHRTEIE